MFHIKKSIILKNLKKKKKANPFNYEQAENYKFSALGDGTQNNSYYFSAHSYEKSQSLYVRLGLRDNGVSEVWVVFNNKDIVYYLKENFYKSENSPLKVQKQGETWSFSFNGELSDNNGNAVPADLSCEFTAKNRVVDFFNHMPSSRVATAMAQDKWKKGYFDGVSLNNSVHYEQEGVINGYININGEKTEIDLPCLRDHSYGRRVWDYMNNHLWIAGVDQKCQVNFSMVSYQHMSVLEVGHIRQGERPVEFVTKTDYNRYEICKNQVPTELELLLTVENKRKVKVKAKLLSVIPYPFEGGAYTLHEGLAELEIDGVKVRGILEIGFNRDITRFMNKKDISKIRA